MAEHWFYHPDLGPWCAITDDDAEVPSEVLDGYREGTVSIPPMPSGGGSIVEHEGHFVWSNAPAPEAVVMPSDVDAERDLRISAGFVFQGHLYQFRPATVADDRENIQGMANVAFGAISRGAAVGDLRWLDPDKDFYFIAADNTRVPMDAQTTYALGLAAVTHKLTHVTAGSDLKKMDPIPSDFRDQHYWPAPSAEAQTGG